MNLLERDKAGNGPIAIMTRLGGKVNKNPARIVDSTKDGD
jgi:hypothetical protein